MEQTRQEWKKVVLLAHYNRLGSTNNLQKNEMLEKVKSILLEEYGLSEEDLKKVMQRYQAEVLPQKEAIIRQKATKLFSDIVAEIKKMKRDESLSTDDYPEIRYRLQEIIAMDPKVANKILQEEEKNFNISHVMFQWSDWIGNLDRQTYYFSFDK